MNLQSQNGSRATNVSQMSCSQQARGINSSSGSFSSIPDAYLQRMQQQIQDNLLQILRSENQLKSGPQAPSPVSYFGQQHSFMSSVKTDIIDFSPEWDYVTGGAKVLICLSTQLPEGMA
mmetsp:Transcript_41670/g.63669  ORF Transcript_41670/g.63669 Transcript_41670/m.63669 type:complete len:119 (+) Transcript_41670:403-759(+)